MFAKPSDSFVPFHRIPNSSKIDSKLIKGSSHLANVIAVKSFVGLITEYVCRSKSFNTFFRMILIEEGQGGKERDRRTEKPLENEVSRA